MMENDLRSRKMPPIGKTPHHLQDDSLFPMQAFGGIWWVTFGKKHPQLSRVMVLPVDITDNANSQGSNSG